MKKIQKIANKYFDQLNFSDSEIAQLPEDFKKMFETSESTELNSRIKAKREELKKDPVFKYFNKEYLDMFLNAFIIHYVEKRLSPDCITSYELAEQVVHDNKSILKTETNDAKLGEITEQYHQIVSTPSVLNYIWNLNEDLRKQLLYTAIGVEVDLNYELYNTWFMRFLQSKLFAIFSTIYCFIPSLIIAMGIVLKAVYLIVTSGGSQALVMVIFDKVKQLHPSWARSTNVPYRIMMFISATIINYGLYKRYFS